MKTAPVKNTIIDEANDITYVVTADRTLTDGEVYRAIRIALLERSGRRPCKGDTLEITWKD